MTVDLQKRPFGDGSKFGSTQIVDVTKFQNSTKIVICACHPSCMRDSTCTFQKYGRTSQKYEFAHIVLSKSTIHAKRSIRIDKYYYFRPADIAKFATSSRTAVCNTYIYICHLHTRPPILRRPSTPTPTSIATRGNGGRRGGYLWRRRPCKCTCY